MHSKFLMVRARYLKVGDRVFDMEEGDTFPVIKIASSGYEAKLLVWVWYGDYCRRCSGSCDSSGRKQKD